MFRRCVNRERHDCNRWERWKPARVYGNVLRFLERWRRQYVMNRTGKSAGRTEEWWASKSGGWATWAVVSVFLALCGLRFAIQAMKKFRRIGNYQVSADNSAVHALIRSELGKRIEIVFESDLQKLLAELGEVNTSESPWQPCIGKRSANVAYSAKRRDPKNGGPTQYLSTTIFEKCSPELLRDFLMDNEYRMKWDNTVVHHEQLEICKETGTEIGRTIKRLPFVAQREYVLAWRVWQGQDRIFYCVIKACDHERAPRQAQYKRVELYTSGWRIRKVPGREDVCEINMWHQEDFGLPREMAKMAFTRSIWNFVCKMEQNLQKYASKGHQFRQGSNAVAFAQKLPAGLDGVTRISGHTDERQRSLSHKAGSSRWHKKRWSFRQSGRWLAKSFLLIGGAVVCTRGSAPFGAKLATLCLLKKVIKPHGRPSLE